MLQYTIHGRMGNANCLGLFDRNSWAVIPWFTCFKTMASGNPLSFCVKFQKSKITLSFPAFVNGRSTPKQHLPSVVLKYPLPVSGMRVAITNAVVLPLLAGSIGWLCGFAS